MQERSERSQIPNITAPKNAKTSAADRKWKSLCGIKIIKTSQIQTGPSQPLPLLFNAETNENKHDTVNNRAAYHLKPH